MERLSRDMKKHVLYILQEGMGVTDVPMVNGYRRWMLYCPKFRLQQSVFKRDRPRSGQPKIAFANDRFYSSTPLIG